MFKHLLLEWRNLSRELTKKEYLTPKRICECIAL